jgi:hypothetical protein
MSVSSGTEPFIAFPAVSDHDRSWLDGLFHERAKARCGSILGAAYPYTADAISIYLGCNHHQGFVSEMPATSAGLYPPDIGFVYLDLTDKAVPPGPYHRPPELV